MVLIWEWYESPPRTESRKYHSTLSELLDFRPILQTSALVTSKNLLPVCYSLPVASCCDLTKTFDRFKQSRTAGAHVSGPSLVLPGLRHTRLRILISPQMCKIGKLEASLKKRRAVKHSQRDKVITSSIRCPSYVSERLLCRGFPHHHGS